MLATRCIFFSCRGYVSQSEMWGASQRLIDKSNRHEKIVLLHLGDHDPSGKDMSRDIVDRLRIFEVYNIEFKRLALNMNQIEQYNPPPNPTKLTDSRATGYIEMFGHECWELDALEPRVITNLIRDNVLMYRDEEIYNKVKNKENTEKELLKDIADNWENIASNWGKIKNKYC